MLSLINPNLFNRDPFFNNATSKRAETLFEEAFSDLNLPTRTIDRQMNQEKALDSFFRPMMMFERSNSFDDIFEDLFCNNSLFGNHRRCVCPNMYPQLRRRGAIFNKLKNSSNEKSAKQIVETDNNNNNVIPKQNNKDTNINGAQFTSLSQSSIFNNGHKVTITDKKVKKTDGTMESERIEEVQTPKGHKTTKRFINDEIKENQVPALANESVIYEEKMIENQKEYLSEDSDKVIDTVNQMDTEEIQPFM